MKLMSPADSLFLLAESREHPMHVAGLQLFTPPPDAGPDYMRNTYEAMRACDDVAPTFRKRPASALGGITNLAWSYDDDVDLDYTYGNPQSELITLTVLVGVVLLAARVLRLGSIVENINQATLVGLKVGVGLTVAAAQLPKLLGVRDDPQATGFFRVVASALRQLGDAMGRRWFSRSPRSSSWW